MPRPARKYSRRIEIYKNTPTDNGFGGEEAVETLVKKIWAEVKSLPREKQIEYGLNVSKFGAEIHCRYPSDDIDWTDQTLFIKFDGKDFKIFEIQNIDFLNNEFRILAAG